VLLYIEKFRGLNLLGQLLRYPVTGIVKHCDTGILKVGADGIAEDEYLCRRYPEQDYQGPEVAEDVEELLADKCHEPFHTVFF